MTDITSLAGAEPRVRGHPHRRRGQGAAEGPLRRRGALQVARRRRGGACRRCSWCCCCRRSSREALPALRMNYMTLPVDLSAAKVDPGQARRGRLSGASRRTRLAAKLPGVESRQDRRLLRGLLSTGAGIILRKDIADDPSMLGKTVDYAFPLDDFADLYLKGLLAGRGLGHPDRDDGPAFRGDRRHRPHVRRRQHPAPGARQWRDRGEWRGPADQQRRLLLVRINGGTVKLTEFAPGANGGVVAKGIVIMPLQDTAAAPSGAATLRVIDTPESSRKISDKEIVWLDALKAREPGREPLQLDLLLHRRQPRAGTRRRLGRGRRLVPDHAGDAGDRLPDRRFGGDLPGGVRSEEPLDDDHRGQHQQPRRGALDRLRPARPCGVPELLRPAAFGAARRRHGAGADDAADHHHRLARLAARRAAVDPRGGARHRRLARCRPCSTTCCRWPCPAS